MTRLLISQSIRQEKWSATNPGEPVKLLILGECGVGKSALVVKYLTRRFIHDYSKCNITYRHCTLVDDEPTLMDIVDWTTRGNASQSSSGHTSNSADERTNAAAAATNTNTSPRTSYSSRSSSGTPPMAPANDYVNVPTNTGNGVGSGSGEKIAGVDISHVKSADGYMIVYSTTDRRSFERATTIKRALDDAKKGMVTAEEGETVAGDLACAFFETSSYASEGWKGIADAFDELCREIRRRKRLEAKPARRKSSAQQIKNLFINKMFKTSHNSQNV